jgi:subtilase family serine protease
MSRLWKLTAPLLAALILAACNSGSSSLPSAPGSSGMQNRSIPHWQARNAATPACPGSRIGQAQCDVLVERGGFQRAVAGWTPAQLEAAYNLPSSTNGSGQIVAVVDAYDNPNAASDLAKYRSNFGLPAANFYKYNQDGQQSNYPAGSVGWGVEIDLDVQMVSASCPLCTIYLIEANSSTWTNLQTAEAEAVKLGATIISNSYSGGGASESYYDTPGIAYLASAGDDGYGLYDPATFKAVVAVGGTVLSQSGSKYSEVVWDDSGGGCSSTNEPKPSWQHDRKCKLRTGDDASAVAWDAAEYDTYGYGGWITVGGTSVSSPLLGGVFGLAGNATSQDGGEMLWTLSPSQLSADLHDITSGSIIHCPTQYVNTYLCKAGTRKSPHYSGPTGWGSPNGIGAF